MPLPSVLPETIPIFPLPGALLLPRARLPLHIFEPRYLAMIDDALRTEARLIGMIQPYEGAGGARLHAIGCAGARGRGRAAARAVDCAAQAAGRAW